MTITTLFPFCPPPPSSTISFSFHFINVAFFSPELKIKRVLKKGERENKRKDFFSTSGTGTETTSGRRNGGGRSYN